MSVSIEVNLYGGQIGRALPDDPEEVYYTLKAEVAPVRVSQGESD